MKKGSILGKIFGKENEEIKKLKNIKGGGVELLYLHIQNNNFTVAVAYYNHDQIILRPLVIPKAISSIK